MELRKKNYYQNYIPPKFLVNTKERVIKDIMDLEFSKELFDYTFGNKLPTFDKHYIISTLINCKGKFEKLQKSKKKKNIKNDNIKVECKKYFQFDDQMLIDEREIYFGNKEDNLKDKNNNNKKIKNPSEEICNFCKTNKINIIFLYCKHKFCCINCIPKISNNICPICDKRIESYVRIYGNI